MCPLLGLRLVSILQVSELEAWPFSHRKCWKSPWHFWLRAAVLNPWIFKHNVSKTDSESSSKMRCPPSQQVLGNHVFSGVQKHEEKVQRRGAPRSLCHSFWNTDVNLQSWRSLPSCILLSRGHNEADREMPVVGRAFHISVSLAPRRLCVYHVIVGYRNQGIHPALFPPLLHKFPTYPST